MCTSERNTNIEIYINMQNEVFSRYDEQIRSAEDFSRYRKVSYVDGDLMYTINFYKMIEHWYNTILGVS